MLAQIALRLLLAPVGFVCGLLAGFATLAAISASAFGDVALFPDEVALLGMDFAVGAWTMAFLFAPLVGAPAMVAVVIGEMFAIRTWTYYAVVGALTAALPWALLPSGVDGPLFQPVQVLACGFVGGLVHWLVAGRSAGVVEPEPAPPSQPPQ